MKDEEITYDAQLADKNMQKIIECCEYLKKSTDEKDDETMFKASNLPLIFLAFLWAFCIFYLLYPSPNSSSSTLA